jgi:hypothetical protein
MRPAVTGNWYTRPKEIWATVDRSSSWRLHFEVWVGREPPRGVVVRSILRHSSFAGNMDRTKPPVRLGRLVGVRIQTSSHIVRPTASNAMLPNRREKSESEMPPSSYLFSEALIVWYALVMSLDRSSARLRSASDAFAFVSG